MTPEDYLVMRSRLFAILPRLPSVLISTDLRLIGDYIEANEFGLALETMIDAVRERGGRINRSLRNELDALAIQMDLVALVQERLDEITSA